MATILTKKKDTTGAPVAGDLTNSSGGAELAVNTADKRLYTKDSGGNVVEVGTNPGTAVTFTAGTVSAPAITTTGDTNTGVFFPAADTIAFAEGGAEAMRINSDSQVVTTAGTASLPAITTTGDLNTGIFFPAADTIAFAEGGAEAMRIDSSGNVGIGTSSPAGRLGVQSPSSNAALTNSVFVFNDGSGSGTGARINLGVRAEENRSAGVSGFYDGTGTSLAFYTTATYASGSQAERARIDSSGNVGIGTSSPNISGGASGSTALTISATSSARNGILELKGTRSNDTEVVSYIRTFNNSGATPITDIQSIRGASDTTGTLAFLTSNTERARITSDGTLMVGTTNTDPTFNRVNGLNLRSDGRIYSRGGNWDLGLSSSSGTNINFYSDNGSARVAAGTITSNGSTTTYGTGSDYRMKTNVQPMSGALAKVLQLKPVTYTWKEEFAGTKPNGQGFIAHELQEVCPDAVTGEKDATEIQQVEVSPAIPATYDEDGNELTPAVEATYEEREVPVYQGVDTSFLVATLTAAIQELKAELDAAKERIATLEAK